MMALYVMAQTVSWTHDCDEMVGDGLTVSRTCDCDGTVCDGSDS